MSDLPLIREVPSDCCPYCEKPVGYLGRALAWFFGTGFHGCDFSNVAVGYPSQAPATGKADTGLPVNSPKE